jgi:hypothetical protein
VIPVCSVTMNVRSVVPRFVDPVTASVPFPFHSSMLEGWKIADVSSVANTQALFKYMQPVNVDDSVINTVVQYAKELYTPYGMQYKQSSFDDTFDYVTSISNCRYGSSFPVNQIRSDGLAVYPNKGSIPMRLFEEAFKLLVSRASRNELMDIAGYFSRFDVLCAFIAYAKEEARKLGKTTRQIVCGSSLSFFVEVCFNLHAHEYMEKREDGPWIFGVSPQYGEWQEMINRKNSKPDGTKYKNSYNFDVSGFDSNMSPKLLVALHATRLACSDLPDAMREFIDTIVKSMIYSYVLVGHFLYFVVGNMRSGCFNTFYTNTMIALSGTYYSISLFLQNEHPELLGERQYMSGYVPVDIINKHFSVIAGGDNVTVFTDLSGLSPYLVKGFSNLGFPITWEITSSAALSNDPGRVPAAEAVVYSHKLVPLEGARGDQFPGELFPVNIRESKLIAQLSRVSTRSASFTEMLVNCEKGDERSLFEMSIYIQKSCALVKEMLGVPNERIAHSWLNELNDKHWRKIPFLAKIFADNYRGYNLVPHLYRKPDASTPTGSFESQSRIEPSDEENGYQKPALFSGHSVILDVSCVTCNMRYHCYNCLRSMDPCSSPIASDVDSEVSASDFAPSDHTRPRDLCAKCNTTIVGSTFFFATFYCGHSVHSHCGTLGGCPLGCVQIPPSRRAVRGSTLPDVVQQNPGDFSDDEPDAKRSRFESQCVREPGHARPRFHALLAILFAVSCAFLIQLVDRVDLNLASPLYNFELQNEPNENQMSSKKQVAIRAPRARSRSRSRSRSRPRSKPQRSANRAPPLPRRDGQQGVDQMLASGGASRLLSGSLAAAHCDNPYLRMLVDPKNAPAVRYPALATKRTALIKSSTILNLPISSAESGGKFSAIVSANPLQHIGIPLDDSPGTSYVYGHWKVRGNVMERVDLNGASIAEADRYCTAFPDQGTLFAVSTFGSDVGRGLTATANGATVQQNVINVFGQLNDPSGNTPNMSPTPFLAAPSFRVEDPVTHVFSDATSWHIINVTGVADGPFSSLSTAPFLLLQNGDGTTQAYEAQAGNSDPSGGFWLTYEAKATALVGKDYWGILGFLGGQDYLQFNEFRVEVSNMSSGGAITYSSDNVRFYQFQGCTPQADFRTSIDRWRFLAGSALVTQMASTLNQGGQIACANVQGCVVPYDSSQDLLSYDGIVELPYDSKDHNLMTGSYTVMKPLDDLVCQKFHPIGDRDTYANTYIVVSGRVPSTSATVVRLVVDAVYEVDTVSQSFNSALGPMKPHWIQEARAVLCPINPCTENGLHLGWIKSIYEKAKKTLSPIVSPIIDALRGKAMGLSKDISNRISAVSPEQIYGAVGF